MSATRKLRSRAAMALSLVMLGACAKPPLSQAEDDRIDEAMTQVKIEQDRTVRAEILKQTSAAAAARDERLVQATPARTIQPTTPRQHFPAEVRSQLPSERPIAASSGTGN